MLTKEFLLGIKRNDVWKKLWDEELAEIAYRKSFLSGMTNNSESIKALVIWEAKVHSIKEKQATLFQEIIDAVESIPNERDRTLIRLRYIEGRTWDDIAECMHYSFQWVHHLHNQFWKKEGGGAVE